MVLKYSLKIFFNFYLICLLIFGCTESLLLLHRLSLVASSGSYSSLRRLLLLQTTGSRCTGFSSCGTWATECGLSSCFTRA